MRFSRTEPPRKPVFMRVPACLRFVKNPFFGTMTSHEIALPMPLPAANHAFFGFRRARLKERPHFDIPAEQMASKLRAGKSDSHRKISVRSLRTLLAFIQLTGKARLMFRDIAGEALRIAELEFRDVFIWPATRKEMKTPLSPQDRALLNQ